MATNCHIDGIGPHHALGEIRTGHQGLFRYLNELARGQHSVRDCEGIVAKRKDGNS